MIPQSGKPAAKQLTQKSKVSSNKKKSLLASKSSFSTCKAKPEILSSKRSSRGSSPPHVPPKFYNDQPREDHHHLKVEAMELTTQYPGNRAAQGVQEFLKEVSQFIEKENPFRVTSGRGCPNAVKPENAQKDEVSWHDSRFFNFDKTSENNKFKRYSEKSKVLAKSKGLLEGTPVSNSRTIIPTRKGIQRGSPNFLLEERKSNDPIKVEGYVGSTVGNKRELKAKPSLKDVGSRSRFEGWADSESPNNTPPVRPSRSKRPGRSEIPLRKPRTDMSKNPKPVSLLLQKSLKEIESTISIDFYSKKKPFTPIEELSLCSEMQSPSANASSEKLNSIGKKNSPRALKKDVFLEEPSNGFKLDRCIKSSNIPVDSNPSYGDVMDQKSCTTKRSKVLDLDKVKTTSFTALQNSREALCRLESLHQQNVSTKESVFGEKLSCSKLKMLTSQPSINALKKKGSKKNLSTRLSSKGNKPALKVKIRKSKKYIDESLMLPKKCQKVSSKTPGEETSQGVMKSTVLSNLMPEIRNDKELISRNVSGNNLGRDSKKPNTREEFSMLMDTQSISQTKFEELENELKAPISSSKKSMKYFDDEETDERKSKEKIEYPPFPLNSSEFIVASFTTVESSSLEDRQTDEDERSSSKTVTLGKPRMGGGASSVTSEDSQTQSHPSKKTNSKSFENVELVVKGTSLKCVKDEPSERPEGSEPKKNKIHIKINLTTPEDTDCEENANIINSIDRLFTKSDESAEEQPQEGGSSEAGVEKEEEINDTGMLSGESAEKEQVVPAIQKSRKSSQFLRSRLQYKVSGANLKGVRKKKVRSDAGDRMLPSSTGFFKSVALQNKIKLDTKVRSGLTKAYTREEKRDLMDDNASIKLKRRNSEPISFRGYIWKRADSVTPRGHKASVSSMASSLKHLNTDDIDDFIFWEAVPQKMTACWEMSLYHSKRPWSVLSCSVFEDNRQSSTPGLILENLRSGGSYNSRRSVLNSNEKAGRPKDNPFDVEPSIAQKNIDIRNWLAALNFPAPPSTSVDVISEGNFSTQSSVDSQNLSKGQVNPKRRKVLASLRFSEETADKKTDEKESKYKKSTRWNASEVDGLMDLIRRKSGGFVTNEQFLNSEHSIHRPNVTVNVCLYSKTPEEKPTLREVKNRNVSSEPKTFKSSTKSPSSEVEKPVLLNPAQSDVVEHRSVQKESANLAEGQKCYWGKVLKGELVPLPSDLNIWKYLFLFTLLIISVHYCFLNNNVGLS